MPSYAGQLQDSEIDDIIAFMKTLDGSNPEAKAAAAAAPAAATSDAEMAKMSPAERGKHWYETKLCATCHSLDGSARVGPSFKGVYGKQHKLTDGSTIIADEAYLKESMLNPMAKVVEGYPPAMPAGLVDEKQAEDLIEFLKTVK
jgi:cytochrome c oxidase subunit 2